MKHFIPLLLAISLISCQGKRSGMISFPEQSRLSGQTDVMELACDPVDTVGIALIGMEMGGVEAAGHLSSLKGARIKAIYDLDPKNLANVQATLKEMGCPVADEYSGDEEWRSICEREDIDLIYICAPKEMHATIAVFAMENGKHVATEPPAALTLDECWDIVNTAEKTRRHLIMLERRCYDFYEMAILNMAQQGYFGEVLSVESGDINHTFGIGPAAQVLNIHRGDKMNYLLSVSGANNTIIKTEKEKTIIVRNDSLAPRPYRRVYNISGIVAFAQENPGNLSDSILRAYEHPIVKGFRKADLIMDQRLIYCLQNGLPLDQDVYDAAEWSAIDILGKVSAKHNGKPVWIPDFTRGSWDKVKGYKQYKNDK